MSHFNLTPAHLKTIAARRNTAAEWFEHGDPYKAEDVLDFYRNSFYLNEEIEAWHEEPVRASWTNSIVDLALKTERRYAVDIGCGLGHDLEALRDAGLMVCGVEPNQIMREAVKVKGIPCYASLDKMSGFDLILCIDVLEHLPHPDTLLNRITLLAEPDAILVEHTPTWDLSDVLHPISNYGWTVADNIGDGWKFIGQPGWPVGCWQRI